MEQFKRAQNRRFLGWLKEASQAGSLSVMTNRLRSSFGRYDYGALTQYEIRVRLLREVIPAPGSDGPPELLQTPLPAGAEFAWRPRQRNYFGNIDLRTHCAIGPRSANGEESGYHGIHVPWDALALDLSQAELSAPEEQRRVDCLQSREHLEALNRLLDALTPCIDLMDSESTSNYTPALEDSCSLYMLLWRLVEVATLDKSPGYRELILDRLNHDLPKIDFPNLLATRGDASGDDRTPLLIMENRWVKRPEGQAEWSEAVHTAHSHALDAYLDWESIFQRCVGAK